MDLHLSLSPGAPIARQVFDQIRDAILSGRLTAGDRVPSSRELAASLGVARNIVATALDHLCAEGLLTARRGVGTFVSGEYRRTEAAGQSRAAVHPVPLWGRTTLTVPDLRSLQPAYDFRAGIPDASRFPFPTWRRLMDQQTRRSAGPGTYADPAGPWAARDAVARHLAVSRGLRISPEEVMITNGVQQAAALVAQMLVEPGDVVAVEDPGYPPVRRALEAVRAKVVPVPVDDHGIVVERLPDQARLIYVTPAHQFPLGVRMTMARRSALLDWAEAAGAAVVEDDYDTDFRYDGRPLDPLHALDRSGRVLYLGSFSKTLLPDLRLGYCVAPPEILTALRKARFAADWCGPPAPQLALGNLIAEGRLAAHVRSMRRTYHDRRDRITAILDRDFADALVRLPSVAGLHLAAQARDATRREVDAWAARARDAGVGIDTIHNFALADTRPGFVLGFGAIDEEHIADGLHLLRRSMHA